MVNEKAYWVALSSVSGIGPARFAALLERFGSASAVWTEPVERLATAKLDRRTSQNLLQARSEIDPELRWLRVQQAGVTCLTWEDGDYPEALRQTDGAPPVLYVDGALADSDRLAVAIVGTRRASSYGREIAHQLATELARNGITIVSGLALGIDTVAHTAALKAGGRTLSVLGSGVDQIYPTQNRGLAQEIRQQGAILSEYWLGTRPEAMNFPPRNRIISGLSQAIVIVEAGKRSGALITATFAAEQGREVFAIPGSILHPGSIGCNRLIQQGATPLLSVDDVLDQLQFDRIRETTIVRQSVPTDPSEQAILDLLSTTPLHVDDIARSSSLQTAQISSLLAVMELKGLVRQTGALRYVKT